MNICHSLERRWLMALIALLIIATGTQAANQYWDSTTNAGYQHGDGVWSTGATATNWSGTTGTNQPGTWTNGSTAIFLSLIHI